MGQFWHSDFLNFDNICNMFWLYTTTDCNKKITLVRVLMFEYSYN